MKKMIHRRRRKSQNQTGTHRNCQEQLETVRNSQKQSVTVRNRQEQSGTVTNRQEQSGTVRIFREAISKLGLKVVSGAFSEKACNQTT